MIQINDLSFSYGKEPLFKELSLSLKPGTIYGLLGKNGAGKTTLLKLLCGFIFPKKGTISVFGENPTKRRVRMLQEIYFIPEEFYIPSCTGIKYAELNGPFYPRFDTERFMEYFSEFELDPKKKLSEYSYGQKKKILVAFGLATDCSLLLLDEPTNGLDIPSKSQFRRLVAGAVTDERIFVISTHQVRDMENLIDPLIILDNGKIIFQQEIAEIGKHLAFRFSSIPQEDEAIYSEKVMGGYLTIVPGREGEETTVDIEVLFNALMNARKEITKIFQRG